MSPAARGDYRDGTGLSFTPPPRRHRTGGRALGVFLVMFGLALAAFGAYSQWTSDPIKNMGHSVPGVIIGYEKNAKAAGPGLYVELSYTTDGDAETHYTFSRDPAKLPIDKTRIGTTYTVFYDPDHPDETFISGIDNLPAPWQMYGPAMGVAGLGIFFAVRPPGRLAEQADIDARRKAAEERRRSRNPNLRLRWK